MYTNTDTHTDTHTNSYTQRRACASVSVRVLVKKNVLIFFFLFHYYNQENIFYFT